MENRKRIAIMLAVFVLLIVANVAVRLNQPSMGSAGLFTANDGLPEANPPAIQRTIDDINQLPKLSFRFTQKAAAEDTAQTRNPFIFGTDRQLEAQRRQAMANLDAARREAEQAASQAELAQMTAEPVAETPRFEGRVLAIMEDSEGPVRKVAVAYAGDIYILRVGDVLNQQYKTLAIGYSEIRLENLITGEAIAVAVESN